MKTLFGVCLMLVVAMGCGGPTTEVPAPAEEAAAHDHAAEPVAEQAVEARHDLLYVCNCGPECECETVSTEPGTCECGKELVEGRMLMIDGTVVSLCTCGPECKCEIGDDPTTCGCGNEMKMVDLAGSDLFYCNCGGSCKCNHVSPEPGTCGCGMELKTS